MRLADRLFAFRRLPAWTDAVQVLLWAMGWTVVVASAAMAGFGAVVLTRSLWRLDGFGGLFLVVLALSFAVWFLGGSWFVSEAYRGWRAGHPHGRGWVFVIAGLLLMNSVPSFWLDRDPGVVNLVLRALAFAFAVALLVASATTKPPQRDGGVSA